MKDVPSIPPKPFKAVDGVVVGDVRSPEARCPYCREPATEETDAYECGGCRGLTHRGCLDETRGSSCLICGAAIAEPPAPRSRTGLARVVALAAVLAILFVGLWVGLRSGLPHLGLGAELIEAFPQGPLEVALVRREAHNPNEQTLGELPEGPILLTRLLRARSDRGTIVERVVDERDVSTDELERLRRRVPKVTWIDPDWSLTVEGPDSPKRIYWLGHQFSPPVTAQAIRAVDAQATPLSPVLRRRLARTGLTASELETLQEVHLGGTWAGADMAHMISARPNVVVVLDPDFETHGDVVAKGPIVSLAHTMGNLASASWILLDDHAFPRGTVDARWIFKVPAVRVIQAELRSPTTDLPEFYEGRLADLQHTDGARRQAAAQTLARHASELSPAVRAQARTALLPLLKDPFPTARQAAAWALGELEAKEARPALLSILEDPLLGVPAQTLRTLRALGPTPDMVPAIARVLRNPGGFQGPEARRLAAVVLGETGSAEALQPLVEALAEAQDTVARGDPDGRGAALERACRRAITALEVARAGEPGARDGSSSQR